MLSAIAMLAGVFQLCAQNVSYSNYNTEDGIPSAEVYSVVQASNGLLWFGSDRGVFTYNGFQFKTYTTRDGLGNNTIFSIFHGPDQSLWFTGYNGTLTSFQNRKFQIHKPISDYMQKNFPADWISFVEFDQGCIYFLVQRSNTLVKFNESSGACNVVRQYDQLPVGSVIGIGRHRYVVNKSIHLNYPFRTFVNKFSRLIPFGNSHFVFAENNKLFLLGNSMKVMDSMVLQSMMDGKNILIPANDSGSLYLACAAGFYKCTIHENKINAEQYSSLSELTGIAEDREGNVWMTSKNQAIFKIPSLKITSLSDDYAHADHFIAINKAGEAVVAGTNTGKLVFYYPDGRVAVVRDELKSLPVEQIVPVDEKRILARNLLSRVDWNRWDRDNAWDLNFVCRIREGLYAATDGQSVVWYHAATGSMVHSVEVKRFGNIRCIGYVNRKIWLGSITGLWSADAGEDCLKGVVSWGEKYPVFANRVNDIKAFRNGVLLSVFGVGTLFFDGVHPPVSVQPGAMGPNDLVNRILVLDSQRIVLCTNNGLIAVTFETESNFRIASEAILNKTDGLNSNFINDACVQGNTLWVATNKGINRMALSELAGNHAPPFVRIQGVKTPDDSLHQGEIVVLNPSENSFQILFEGISFRKPNRFAFYKYAILEKGKDTVWQYTDDSRIQFVNLKPSRYVFLVAARNKNNNWSAISRLEIEVKPHFTQTIWFLVLMAVLLSLLVFATVRWRMRRVREVAEQKKNLERLKHRAREMELNSLRNQMNPHFIFNSLNSIQRYMITNHFDDANAYITRFARLMRDSLTMSKLQLVELKKELAFLTNYLDLEKMRFENLFDYQITCSEELFEDFVKIPPLLIQPLLENSIKHGFKERKSGGLLEVRIEPYGQNMLRVLVTDNGKGMDPQLAENAEGTNSGSYGLNIVRERISFLKEQNPDSSFKMRVLNSGVHIEMIIPKN